MRPVPARVAVPFLLALLGVLVAIGLLVDLAAGHVVTVFYAVLCAGAVVAAAVTARRRVRAAAVASGRTCTCCTGTVHDPVQVI